MPEEHLRQVYCVVRLWRSIRVESLALMADPDQGMALLNRCKGGSSTWETVAEESLFALKRYYAHLYSNSNESRCFFSCSPCVLIDLI
jgi:hypothetical protein